MDAYILRFDPNPSIYRGAEASTFVQKGPRKRNDIHLCRDAADLHNEVLPEVVFGEFHAAVRAPSRKAKAIGGRGRDKQAKQEPHRGGMDGRVSKV